MNSQDKTFRTFTAEQAAAYASGRGGSYPEPLYQKMMDFHSGPCDAVLDVGTGPGTAVWDLLRYFQRGIGCDTSEQMIEQAKKDAIKLGVAERTFFSVGDGEACTDALSSAGVMHVDAVTVAMAAHWFDLPLFYASAAKALRPGGTLALWTCSSFYCHPSVPHHQDIQAALSNLEDNLLEPYMTAGNHLSRGAYERLTLPWNIFDNSPPFCKDSFQRADWDRHGLPSSPPLPDGTPGPFLFGEHESVDQLEAGLNSASAVIRWREANPGKVHTAEDVVKLTMNRIRDIVGGENPTLNVGPSCSLLLMRRV
ncbi:hypothetical protein M433DRAFT_140010 [Acidomyces richmondensis BFW]|nr:MAG: hypothetical protein FE78DRAFT_153286 [Acidomyces sp. 'richmondensis']KYG49489.1 hypothetical protein M433DRAFT_140010 [Acidomyces richmondensis BFW]